MRFLTVRRLALAAFLPALLTVTFIPGCSQQGEGERCGDEIGTADSDDCASGLVCTQIDANHCPPIKRCCDPNRITDSRCIVATSGAAESNNCAKGAAGASSAAGAASVAGASNVAGATSVAGASNVAGASDAGAAGN